MKAKSEEHTTDMDTPTIIATTMLRVNIKDYRRGNKQAEKFLFEGRFLRDFLEDLGFNNIRLDVLRQRIKQGAKLIKLG